MELEIRLPRQLDELLKWTVPGRELTFLYHVEQLDASQGRCG
jgi:hypothetical protein